MPAKMADTEQKKPLTVTAVEVNRVIIGHQMGALEWQRMDADKRQALVDTVRADAVGQMSEHYPNHLYAFGNPKVEAQGTGLTVASDRTLDRGVTVQCPVFVFEPQVQEVPDAPPARVEAYLEELAVLNAKYGMRLQTGYDDLEHIECFDGAFRDDEFKAVWNNNMQKYLRV